MGDQLEHWGLSSRILHLLLDWGIRIAGVLFILLVALMVSRLLQNLVRTRLEESKFDKTLARLLGTLVRWVVLITASVSCLGIFGIETTSFAAILGGSALTVGLALQGTLSNVAAGSMLLVLRPFRVDDKIVIGNARGQVYEIGLFTTTLDTDAGHRVIIPNNKVFGDVIENTTLRQKRRLELPVRVSYAADIDQTRQVLLGALVGLKHQIAPPEVFLADLDKLAAHWRLRVYCRPAHFEALHEDILRALKAALQEADIALA